MINPNSLLVSTVRFSIDQFVCDETRCIDFGLSLGNKEQGFFFAD